MANKRRSRTSRGRRGAVEQAPPVDFASEYHYVLSDLRRLGIAAGTLFGLLVILSFIL